jgi:hypothetical protein
MRSGATRSYGTIHILWDYECTTEARHSPVFGVQRSMGIIGEELLWGLDQSIII